MISGIRDLFVSSFIEIMSNLLPTYLQWMVISRFICNRFIVHCYVDIALIRGEDKMALQPDKVTISITRDTRRK